MNFLRRNLVREGFGLASAFRVYAFRFLGGVGMTCSGRGSLPSSFHSPPCPLLVVRCVVRDELSGKSPPDVALHTSEEGDTSEAASVGCVFRFACRVYGRHSFPLTPFRVSPYANLLRLGLGRGVLSRCRLGGLSVLYPERWWSFDTNRAHAYCTP